MISLSGRLSVAMVEGPLLHRLAFAHRKLLFGQVRFLHSFVFRLIFWFFGFWIVWDMFEWTLENCAVEWGLVLQEELPNGGLLVVA